MAVLNMHAVNRTSSPESELPAASGASATRLPVIPPEGDADKTRIIASTPHPNAIIRGRFFILLRPFVQFIEPDAAHQEHVKELRRGFV